MDIVVNKIDKYFCSFGVYFLVKFLLILVVEMLIVYKGIDGGLKVVFFLLFRELVFFGVEFRDSVYC